MLRAMYSKKPIQAAGAQAAALQLRTADEKPFYKSNGIKATGYYMIQ